MSRRFRRASSTSCATSSTRVAFLVAAGLGLACAGVGGFGSSEAAERAYSEAAAAAKADPRAGEVALEAFLRDWPRSDRADDAALDLALLRLERGDRAGAADVLRESLRRHPRGDRVDRSRLLLARLDAEAGRSDDAWRVASGIRPSRLSPERRIEAHRLLADLALARGERVEAVRQLGRIASDAESGAARSAAEREIDALVAELDRAELEKLSRRLGGERPAGRVRLRAAELAIRDGDFDAAEDNLARARDLPLDPDERTWLETLTARARAREGDGPQLATPPSFADVARRDRPRTEAARGSVGVVLPLSGSFARFGEASLRGVMLAAGVFAGEGTPAGVRLVVRDSGGDGLRAARAVSELASDSEVRAIVGPLLGAESEAAAAAAERAGVPLLTLTAREQVAGSGPNAFRLGLTPRAEAAVLADYAVRELGVERVAILHPTDAYGRGLKNLFWDAIEARGGSVVGVGRYDTEATDFAKPIRRLIGYLLLGEQEKAILRERKKLLNRAKRVGPEEAALLREEAAALTGPDEEPLPPLVDFQALFIADTHERVALIAPQLAFHEVGEVTLLGAGGWNHPDLLAIGGRHVEGSVFTEGFYADSRFPFVSEFRQRYRATFGEEPDLSAAQAFDATNLVLVQLARGRDSRDALREGLLEVRGYPGVAGVTSITPDGNASKRPFLVGVRGGHVVALD